MIKLLYLAKKIHRFIVLIVTTLFIVMAISGLIIKYPSLFSKLGFLDLGMVRYIHNQLSIWLTIVLFIMALSGLIMYFLPMKLFKHPEGETHSH